MTTRRLFILTGASRGLGAAVARQLLHDRRGLIDKHRVFSLFVETLLDICT